jgi:hypothetical protein
VSAAEHESKERAEKATQAQLAQQTEIDDLLWLMGDKRGRRFVWRQLAEAGVFQVTFTGEALSGAFKEGQRSRGLSLLASISQHCPGRYSEMQRENLKRNERKQEGTAS